MILNATSTNDINAVQWLCYQYGVQSIPFDSTMCNGYPQIICSPNGDVIQINLKIETSQGVEMPNATMPLIFDSLTILEITLGASTRVAIPSINILSKLTNMPKLVKIAITNDPTIDMIPTSFPTMIPNLSTLQLINNKQLTTIQNPIGFIQHPNLAYLSILGSPLKHVTVNSSIGIPNLTELQLSLIPTEPKYLDLQSSKFPRLRYLVMNNNILGNIYTGPPITITFNSKVLSTVTLIGNSFKLSIVNTSSLLSLYISGKQSTLTPSTIESYPNLARANLNDITSSIVSYNQYPTYLQFYGMTNSTLTTIPNIPFPESMKSIDFSNNQLQGQIDFNTLFPPVVSSMFTIHNNPGITGSIPESFCANYLYANNTGLVSIPDCFWCYYGNPYMFQIYPQTLPPNFVCTAEFNSTLIPIKSNLGMIYGRNLGYGAIEQGYALIVVIANSQMLMHITNTPRQGGPPRTVSIRPHSSTIYNLSVIETDIIIRDLDISQKPSSTAVLLSLAFYNDYLPHYLTIDQVVNGTVTQQFPCPVVSTTNDSFICETNMPVQPGIVNIHFKNEYYSISNNSIEFIQDNIVKNGSVFTLTGIFSQISAPSTLTFSSVFGDSRCIVTEFSFSQIKCTLEENIKGGPLVIVKIKVDSYSNVYSIDTIPTPYSKCMNDTFNCHDNGQCSFDGFCVCPSPSFYNNCLIPYPTISSSSIITSGNDSKQLIFFGDFGPFNQSGVIVLINETISCNVTTASQQLIQCQLENTPTIGIASVKIQVDTRTVIVNDAILFSNPTPPIYNDEESCRKDTHDCFGNGHCDEMGQCQCDVDYHSIDNCRTKFLNSIDTPNINNVSPIISFNFESSSFQFEIYSIQEIDFESNLTAKKELLISNYNWSMNSNNSNATTSSYTLVFDDDNSNNNSSSNSTIPKDLNVTSIISYNRESSKIELIGGINETFDLNPNSIRLSVSIEGWRYSSNMARLKVLFKTTIPKEQTFIFDCDEQPLDSFTNNQLSPTIQYIRIARDNVQYHGRFVDRVVSDGHPTYSKTELVSLTPLNDQESTAIIGINLPQCQQCTIDPIDFTPLHYDQGSQDCDKSDSWKIIVGVVLGLTAFIALVIASVIIVKKKMLIRESEKMRERKLQRYK
ncbi:Tenascin [Cavenderia fasciculata]|uniref:Tenascin n=1 Tax=Cavenderia fasciculata TaxID=261658 RepID=F4QD71_CACFS|nr:Tenascin [Cavenderia fasciculata]EGG14542.1 Tenascin [Cavenderia fasciculata]|eukprot:XP_004366062.1 Tenascin [Cavenderia fasciculata]